MSEAGWLVRGRWIDPVLAIGGGLVWAACFQREPASVLSWLAFSPLVLLLGRPQPVRWAWLWGVVAWLAMVPWIRPTLETFGGLPYWVSVLGWLATALLMSIDSVLFAWLGARIWRRSRVQSLLVLPSLWIVLEWARGFWVEGFPWNLAAYAWTDVPGALPLSSWVGAWGVGWLLVCANVALAWAVLERRWRGPLAVWLAVANLLVLGGRFAGSDMPRVGGGQVSILQPNSEITFDAAEAWAQYERLLEMSNAECDLGPRLLVWPESAAFPMSWETAPRLREDVLSLARRGCMVFLGTSLFHDLPDGERGVWNAVQLVGPGGVEGRYAKRNLVPFGEYVPFESWLPFIGKLAREAGRYTPGHDPALIPWLGEDLASAVCYEVVFPGAVAEQVRAGGSILVTITNDAWYGDSSAPWQHLRAARFRAAENRRPLLRAALTGVSALVDARGRVTGSVGLGEEGALRARVRGATALSPFSRWPWWPIAACLVVTAWGLLATARTGRRSAKIRPRRDRSAA